jgi:hypothetical protein
MKIAVLKDSNNQNGYVEASELLQPILEQLMKIKEEVVGFDIQAKFTIFEKETLDKLNRFSTSLREELIHTGITNVSASSIVEKKIVPGALRYDAITDKFRKCTKNGWTDL